MSVPQQHLPALVSFQTIPIQEIVPENHSSKVIVSRKKSDNVACYLCLDIMILASVLTGFYKTGT